MAHGTVLLSLQQPRLAWTFPGTKGGDDTSWGQCHRTWQELRVRTGGGGGCRPTTRENSIKSLKELAQATNEWPLGHHPLPTKSQ